MIMGCYGIGIERTVAAAIEQHHDDKGIVFPLSIAPFQVIILSLNPEIVEVREKAEALYHDLSGKGMEVLLDDRMERPGVKFNDADLIGIPLRINVGRKGVKKGVLELHFRETGRTELIDVARIGAQVKGILDDHTAK